MNYKSEYDRLIGELSQNTITPRTSEHIERRKRYIKDADQGNQYAKNIILPYPNIYIRSERHMRNELQRGETSSYV